MERDPKAAAAKFRGDDTMTENMHAVRKLMTLQQTTELEERPASEQNYLSQVFLYGTQRFRIQKGVLLVVLPDRHCMR